MQKSEAAGFLISRRGFPNPRDSRNANLNAALVSIHDRLSLTNYDSLQT